MTAKKGGQKKRSSAEDLVRRRLLEQRQEILSLYRHDLAVGQQASDDGTEDIVDRANNAYNREFMFSLSDTEGRMIDQIDAALARVDEGSYGTCSHCQEKITPARLRALPWAANCIDCQERVEQGLLQE